MIKKIKNLKGIILAMFLVLSFISVAKVRVNVDGSVNINFGRNRNERDRDRSGDYWGNNNNSNQYNIGNIIDSQYDSIPFILNGRGYAVFRNRNSFYLLQVEFINGNPNNVRHEQIFETDVITENCISVTGDSRYCLTITSNGDPALWDRYSGRVRYTGRWLKTTNYYNNSNRFDYDYYKNQSEHWFEW